MMREDDITESANVAEDSSQMSEEEDGLSFASSAQPSFASSMQPSFQDSSGNLSGNFLNATQIPVNLLKPDKDINPNSRTSGSLAASVDTPILRNPSGTKDGAASTTAQQYPYKNVGFDDHPILSEDEEDLLGMGMDMDMGHNNDEEEEKEEERKLTSSDEENVRVEKELNRQTQTYDLGKTMSPIAYDLSKPPAMSGADGGQGNGDGDGDGDVDDQTSDTQHRSGSSDQVLHTWMKRKDWRAIRDFFKNAPDPSPMNINEKDKFYAAIFYANEDGETPLHIACRKKAPYDIVFQLTSRGGRLSVTATNTYGNSTPLHHACHFQASPKVVSHLIDVGGADAARKIDDIGNLPIHWALSKRHPPSVIKHLIEVGGFDTCRAPNRIGWTALHTACYFDANASTIKYLIDVTGPGDNYNIVKHMDKKCRTPLDLIFERNSFCVESVNLLLGALGEVDKASLYVPQHTVNSTLEWVRRQPDTTALETQFVQRVLNETFISNKYLAVWMIDIYFQIALVSIFSFGIDDALRDYDVPITTAAAVGLYVAICWFLGREIVQFITTPFKSFFNDFKNWLDFTQLLLVFMSLDVLVFKGGVQTRSDATLVTLTAGFVWFNLLSVLGRAFYKIRVFLIYIQLLIWNLIVYFIVSFCIIAAFAQMYYITNNFVVGACESPMVYQEDQDWTCSLSDTYFLVFSSVFTGHWRFMEQPSTNPLTRISFVLALVTILLLFTSLVGQVLQLHEQINELGISFWMNRLNTILEIHDFNETFGCGCCQKDIARSNKPRWTVDENDSVSAASTSPGGGLADVPLSRFTFSKGEKYRNFPEDEDKVRDWWLGEKGNEQGVERVPPLNARMGYFLRWAPMSEIIIPGKEFERALGGLEKDEENYYVRVGTYFLFPFTTLAVLVVFVLGLVTCGFLWPKEMKRRIFFGKDRVINGRRLRQETKMHQQIETLHCGVEAIQARTKADHQTVESLEKNMRDLQASMNELMRLMRAAKLGDDSTIDDSEYIGESYGDGYA
mmetsp:Transcript_11638/g.17656  ORF Transcript_11638/g.17656 Transcript_11638/m.17656 type:complete len:1014 (+) Transcript_11638:445-3486(+)